MSIKIAIALAVLAGSVVLTGCATHVSHSISADGVPGEVIFPSPERAVLKEGTFPTIEALQQVGPGVSKNQLYQLLGRPHFAEGFGGVREWDYLFHFRLDDQIRTCQYKVIFDEDYRGSSFYWWPASCESIVQRPQSQLQPLPAATVDGAPPVNRFQLSGDALFSFGRHGIDDISPDGKMQLLRISEKIRVADGVPMIDVVGHSDRIGSRERNRILSERRADTVKRFFVAQGIPATRVATRGAGAELPLVNCADELESRDLIHCLQPNRRVEITVLEAR